MALKKNTSELIENQVSTSKIKQQSDQKSISQKLNTVIPPIRISLSHKTRLEKYFKGEKGLNLSSGVRMLIFEYMRKNNLI